MLTVEQKLSCDICGATINELKQTVPSGIAIQWIDRGTTHGITQWKDVCNDCFGPLGKAFWALKAAGAADDGK